jgi:hypothetical protein
LLETTNSSKNKTQAKANGILATAAKNYVAVFRPRLIFNYYSSFKIFKSRGGYKKKKLPLKTTISIQLSPIFLLLFCCQRVSFHTLVFYTTTGYVYCDRVASSSCSSHTQQNSTCWQLNNFLSFFPLFTSFIYSQSRKGDIKTR